MKKAILLFVLLFCGLVLFGCEAKYTSIQVNEESNTPIKVNEMDIGKIVIELCKDGVVEKTIPLSNSLLSSEDLEKIKTIGTHEITVNYQDLQVKMEITIVGEKYGESCLVSFYNGERELDYQEVEYGGTVVYEGNTPFKVQDDEYEYVFIGWDGSLENITDDVILNAVFEAKSLYHTVTFLGKDGETISVTDPILKNYPATAPKEPTYPGYEFTGWDKEFNRVTEDLIVTALYDEIEYTVTFNANIDAATVIEEKTFASKTEFTTTFFSDLFDFLKDNVGKISGLTLSGTTYSYTRNSQTASWTDATTLGTVDKSIVEKTIGNLIYKPFDRTVIENAYEIEDELYFLNSDKYRTKYKDCDAYFLNCIKASYSSYSTGYTATSAGKVQIFYRFWQWHQGTTIAAFNTLPKYYNVKSSVDESSIKVPTDITYTVTDEMSLTSPTAEIKFLGWYDNNLGYGKKYDSIEKGTYGNITLYAKWDANEDTMTITYVDYDGKVISSNDYTSASSIIIPSNPSRLGYTFTGWDKEITNINCDTCIQAQYEVINYTITYEDNNDNEVTFSGEKYNTYTINDEYDLPILECDGYIFLGWYSDSSLSGSKIRTTSSGNLNLYAKWLDLGDIQMSDLELVATDTKIVKGLSTRVFAKIGTTYYSCSTVDFISDGKVSIDVDGYVVGLQVGKSTIIASYGDKQATLEIEIIDDQDILWVGHTGSRGTGIIQNTASAFEEGGKRGYYALECDVRISKDNVLYIHHDDTFLTSGTVQPWVESSLTAAGITTGTVQANYNWSVLKTLQLHKMSDSSTVGYLCTVEEYLNICKKYNCIAVIEIKWNGGMNSNDQSKLPLLVDLVKQCGMYEKAIFMTSMKNCLTYIRNNYPDANLQFLSGASTTTTDNINWCIENRISLDSVNTTVTQAIVDKMHAAGLYVNAYTVNDSNVANNLIAMGVDMITTDELGK